MRGRKKTRCNSHASTHTHIHTEREREKERKREHDAQYATPDWPVSSGQWSNTDTD